MPSFSFSPAELSYLHASLSTNPPIRPDARTPIQFRPLNAETGVLPATNGSAHLAFSDGSEAIVGVKMEVERTKVVNQDSQKTTGNDEDVDMEDGGISLNTDTKYKPTGKADWITLTLSLPSLRDDDPSLLFLEQMLREALISPSLSLRDNLLINQRWHWHLYIDILLISPHGLAAYPLPLLSLTVYLALRDTRIPGLKSVGEEDPVADDDPERAGWLFPRQVGLRGGMGVPFTLLVVLVGENVLFDPNREELAVADAVVGVSVCVASPSASPSSDFKILAVRTIETPARDTMTGVPLSGEIVEGEVVPGVWRPKLGGVKRGLLKGILSAVGSVAEEVVQGLEGFLWNEGRG